VGSLGLRTGSGTDKVVFGNEVDFVGDPVSGLETVKYSVFTNAPNNASTADRWYLTSPGTTGCDQANYCTLDEIQVALSDATILAAQINKGRDNAFSGAVDDFTINEDTFDFEPNGVTSN